MLAGARLALSWLTVLPTGEVHVDRRVGGRAIAAAPVVGALLGALLAAVAIGLHELAAPALLAGLVGVAVLGLLSRGMHLDGLADVADGFGCYGPPERALAVMRDGSAGPFAVVALVIVLGIQASCIGALAAHQHWVALVLAPAVGRAGFLLGCRRGVPAARDDGLGALVSGTQRLPVVLAWWVVLAAVATFAVPHRPWQGPLGVLLAALLVLLLLTRARRRFGGMTGDVLGASSELGCSVMLLVAVLAVPH
ncbi:MAG: adenosylcobinamide-GDP ribazoletransferase [Sciscionella sp.]